MALVNLDETLEKIAKIVDKGRAMVERDEFLPLAAQQLGARLGHDAAAVPEEWRDRHPDVPWHSIRALRNRLAQDDHQIDFDILWNTFASDLPAVRAILSTEVDAAWRLLVQPPDADAVDGGEGG